MKATILISEGAGWIMCWTKIYARLETGATVAARLSGPVPRELKGVYGPLLEEYFLSVGGRPEEIGYSDPICPAQFYFLAREIELSDEAVRTINDPRGALFKTDYSRIFDKMLSNKLKWLRRERE